MRRPLEDVTILAVEQYGAGPWGTVHLADLGARIIKIEDPTSKGDIGRYVPPFQEGEDSLFFETFCHNKESISLQLRSPEGRATFERLVPHADAVFSNLRGDGPAKLKILYDDLKHLNPAIVCASLTGFGMTGPRAAEGGYDYIAQGMAGWMSLTGDPDGPPTKSGLSLVDMSTGYAAALAMMCALWRARRDGEGCDVDVSLFETAFNLDMYVSTWHLSRGWEPIRTRNSSHPSIVPFGNFPTADGWVVIACAKQKFFENLARAIGVEWMLEDERYNTMAARLENRDECTAELEKALSTNTTAHWVKALAEADVPSGPIYSIAEAAADPQTIARDLIAETEHPVLGTVRQIRSPLRMPGAAEELKPAPKRGEHTRQVLTELAGMDESEINALAEAGAFGDVEV
jgi:crotonobetainyl-CoA:carnitine CoA-transferase CaiB-like acyl-CoA transferase